MTPEADSQKSEPNLADSGYPALETTAQKLKRTSRARADAELQAKRLELERIQSALEAAEGRLQEAEGLEPLGDRYYRDVQIAEMFDVARTTVWRWVQAGHLAAPIKISEGCTRWTGAMVRGLVKRRSA